MVPTENGRAKYRDPEAFELHRTEPRRGLGHVSSFFHKRRRSKRKDEGRERPITYKPLTLKKTLKGTNKSVGKIFSEYTGAIKLSKKQMGRKKNASSIPGCKPVIN